MADVGLLTGWGSDREATMTEGPGAELVDVSEVEHLRRDLVDAREEIVATNAVLTAMGRSASDLDLVLGTIVDSARTTVPRRWRACSVSSTDRTTASLDPRGCPRTTSST